MAHLFFESAILHNYTGAPRKAGECEQVKFLSLKGLATHRESSLACTMVTSCMKRRQSDDQATTIW